MLSKRQAKICFDTRVPVKPLTAQAWILIPSSREHRRQTGGLFPPRTHTEICLWVIDASLKSLLYSSVTWERVYGRLMSLLTAEIYRSRHLYCFKCGDLSSFIGSEGWKREVRVTLMRMGRLLDAETLSGTGAAVHIDQHRFGTLSFWSIGNNTDWSFGKWLRGHRLRIELCVSQCWMAKKLS